ncbi:MAG: hypothetical protein FGF52_02745 [Candidatus Brockarchaeota archaeon]|nr:hypothetical protein [Candidatus Brockarchaeota archaeon]
MESIEDIDEVLRGKTLLLYYYMLRKGKPLSIRQVQAGLRFKSPSQTFYHLNRLQSAGLIELRKEGYVVKRIYLKHYAVISKLIYRRFLFYFVFFATALFTELLILKPESSLSYLFSAIIILLGITFFLYETVKILLIK